jgi:hypothetical protein
MSDELTGFTWCQGEAPGIWLDTRGLPLRSFDMRPVLIACVVLMAGNSAALSEDIAIAFCKSVFLAAIGPTMDSASHRAVEGCVGKGGDKQCCEAGAARTYSGRYNGSLCVAAVETSSHLIGIASKYSLVEALEGAKNDCRSRYGSRCHQPKKIFAACRSILRGVIRYCWPSSHPTCLSAKKPLVPN